MREIGSFLIGLSGVVATALYLNTVATSSSLITKGKTIIIDNSSYKCKMINTLKELENEE